MKNGKPSILEEWKDHSLLEVIKGHLSSPHVTARVPDIPKVEEDSLPICLNCLALQEKEAYFCTECGAPVGDLTNIMPYEYVLSMGDGFRRWVDPNTKLTPLKTTALILASFAAFSILAPFYWHRLYRVRNPKKNIPLETEKQRFKPHDQSAGSQNPAYILEATLTARFKKLSRQELEDSLITIDEEQYPNNYRLLCAELEKRKKEQ